MREDGREANWNPQGVVIAHLQTWNRVSPSRESFTDHNKCISQTDEGSPISYQDLADTSKARVTKFGQPNGPGMGYKQLNAPP